MTTPEDTVTAPPKLDAALVPTPPVTTSAAVVGLAAAVLSDIVTTPPKWDARATPTPPVTMSAPVVAELAGVLSDTVTGFTATISSPPVSCVSNCM